MSAEKVRKRRILVVEPEREFAHMLNDFFAAQRFEVETAESGDEAIEKAGDFVPDIVLLSRELPMNDGGMGPDGLRVLKVLKEDRSRKRVPVILTSAVAKEDDFDRYRKLKFAAEDYVNKPFEDTEILRRIENLVGFDLSDRDDMNRIKAKIDGAAARANGEFFDPETDSIGPAMTASTRQEITKLLEQMGDELERQEQKMASPEEAEREQPFEGREPGPEPEEKKDDHEIRDLRRKVTEFQIELDDARDELESERSRSRKLKKDWKKKLTDIAGRLQESEEREGIIRQEFETMRKRFADLELDHTMELERVHEQKRRIEEELLILKDRERAYPRRQMEADLKKAHDLLEKMVEKLETKEEE